MTSPTLDPQTNAAPSNPVLRASRASCDCPSVAGWALVVVLMGCGGATTSETSAGAAPRRIAPSSHRLPSRVETAERMSAIVPDLRACNTPPFDSDITVRVTVTGRGDVVEAEVLVGGSAPGDALTPLAPDDTRGPCITQTVQRVRFDPFTDAAYRFTFPFRL